MCFSIKIDQPYAPFTHKPGAKIPIPGTDLFALIYPAKVLIGAFSFILPLEERAKEFTAILDLKKGAIFVTVKTKSAYFRYRIKAEGEGAVLLFDRGIKKRALIPCAVKRPLCLEQISSGVYKKQEWELVQKRGDLKEILPLWFMASQWFEKGEEPQDLVESFQEGFRAIFAPQEEEVYTGYKGSKASFPLKALRSYFAHYEKNRLELLPKVPACLTCGRAERLNLENLFSIDLLWSNARLKQAIITPHETGSALLVFPGKECRLRLKKKDPGTVIRSGESLSYTADQRLYLDRFTK